MHIFLVQVPPEAISEGVVWAAIDDCKTPYFASLVCDFQMNELWVGFEDVHINGVLPQNPDSSTESESFYSNPIIKAQLVHIRLACSPLHFGSIRPRRFGLCWFINALAVRRNILDSAPLQFQMIKVIRKKK